MKERKVFHDIKLSIWPVYEYSQQIPVQKNVGFIATGIETWAHSNYAMLFYKVRQLETILSLGKFKSLGLTGQFLYLTQCCILP